MNLSRAKTVLIWSFLILNIFLIYQLWQDQGYGRFASFGQQEEIMRLELALQNADLTMPISLPKSTMSLSYMLAEPKISDPLELIAELWEVLEGPQAPSPSIISTKNEGIGSDEAEAETEAKIEAEEPSIDYVDYFFGKHKLNYRQNGNLSLHLSCGIQAKEGGNEEENSQEEIREILELLGEFSFLEDFTVDYTLRAENGIFVFLRQEYENYPLYTRYAYAFSSAGDETLMIRFFRLDILGFAEQEREIIPSSTALLRFLERYEGHDGPMSILEFSLGYYTQEYDAERWEIPPVWRIRLNNGELYYINAFTGNSEQ